MSRGSGCAVVPAGPFAGSIESVREPGTEPVRRLLEDEASELETANPEPPRVPAHPPWPAGDTRVAGLAIQSVSSAHGSDEHFRSAESWLLPRLGRRLLPPSRRRSWNPVPGKPRRWAAISSRSSVLLAAMPDGRRIIHADRPVVLDDLPSSCGDLPFQGIAG